jgi:hypothetical protein
MEVISRQDKTNSGGQDKVAPPMAFGLAVLAGILRVAPLAYNFSGMGGLGIFGGAKLRLWKAISIQLVLLLVTNAILAMIHGPEYFYYKGMPFVLGGLFVYVLIGRTFRQTQSPFRIGSASLLGSVQFFLISNFGAWLIGGVPAGSKNVLEWGQYYLTLGGFRSLEFGQRPGLIDCYVQGLPFFGTTLVSDLFFTAAAFGLHAMLSQTRSVRRAVPVHSLSEKS